MMRAPWLLVALALGGCASQRGTQTKSQIRTIEESTKVDELYERGRAFAAVGDFTRAEEYFAAALERGGDAKRLIPLILFTCMQDGRYRLAAQYAEEHLRKVPSDTRTRFVLGSIYAGLGEDAAAERELQSVLTQQPGQAEAHYALGKLLFDGKRSLSEADRHFREYLRLAPQGPHAAEAQALLLHELPADAAPVPASSGAPVPLPEVPQ